MVLRATAAVAGVSVPALFSPAHFFAGPAEMIVTDEIFCTLTAVTSRDVSTGVLDAQNFTGGAGTIVATLSGITPAAVAFT